MCHDQQKEEINDKHVHYSSKQHNFFIKERKNYIAGNSSRIARRIPVVLYVPLILQQIQISVDQPYAGPGCQLLHYQR
jgi:hypothetical protein